MNWLFASKIDGENFVCTQFSGWPAQLLRWWAFHYSLWFGCLTYVLKTLIWAMPSAHFLSTCLSWPRIFHILELCTTYIMLTGFRHLGTSGLHQILRLSHYLHFAFLLFQKVISWISPSFCSETMSLNPIVSGGFSTWLEIGYTIRGPKPWSWWSSMTKSAPRVWASWLAMGKETCND